MVLILELHLVMLRTIFALNIRFTKLRGAVPPALRVTTVCLVHVVVIKG